MSDPRIKQWKQEIERENKMNYIGELKDKILYLERENAELAGLLGIMFDTFENGDPCYDTPNDPGAVYLGNAVRLEDHTFKRIVDALDRNKVKETNK
jgi:hypothetical protein